MHAIHIQNVLNMNGVSLFICRTAKDINYFLYETTLTA